MSHTRPENLLVGVTPCEAKCVGSVGIRKFTASRVFGDTATALYFIFAEARVWALVAVLPA